MADASQTSLQCKTHPDNLPDENARSNLTAFGLDRAVSVDLEWNGERIMSIGALRCDTVATFARTLDTDPAPALAELDRYCAGADYIVGHNIVEHDLPILAAVAPGLDLLTLPAIDTLLLNPITYPRNPYHHLVKHYRDPAIRRARRNDPLLDAGLALILLADQCDRLTASSPAQRLAWHGLFAAHAKTRGLARLMGELRSKTQPDEHETRRAIRSILEQHGCPNQAAGLACEPWTDPLGIVWTLGWLPVAGASSVLAPYVQHRSRLPRRFAHTLRATRCKDPRCTWCERETDPATTLLKWFGHEQFREEPRAGDGRPAQRAIIDLHLAGRHTLGIMPTGSGKSVCYQVPALMRHEASGDLTVVICPLQALMNDIVQALRAKGVDSIDTINGSRLPIENVNAMERVLLGNTSILVIAPEQLRKKRIREVIGNRSIGAWVIDEAHCLSSWGHDFRPDYRSCASFIARHTGDGEPAPILALTATATPEVRRDLEEYFQDKLRITMDVVDAGTDRSNLTYTMIESARAQRHDATRTQACAILDEAPGHSGVIVYCTTRADAEATANALSTHGIKARHFHGKVESKTKHEVLEAFLANEIEVVAATNAFGMGIDKANVRGVVHNGMPESIENYLQESGRAGRDGLPAKCVVLYDDTDIDARFEMVASSRIAIEEFQGALRALRRATQRKSGGRDENRPVTLTTSELLMHDTEGEIRRDNDPDTRVRTMLGWLEEREFIKRHDNQVTILPSSLQVDTVEEARERIRRARTGKDSDLTEDMIDLVRRLIAAPPNTAISTDELPVGWDPERKHLRQLFFKLERLKIATNDMALSAMVHEGTQESTQKRLSDLARIERAIIRTLDEQQWPAYEGGERIALRVLAEYLHEANDDTRWPRTIPDQIAAILLSTAKDWSEHSDKFRVRRAGRDHMQIDRDEDWATINDVAERRQAAAARITEHLVSQLDPGIRGTDLLVDTTYGRLDEELRRDTVVRSKLDTSEKRQRIIDRSLLWMHDHKVLTLDRGLVVFRNAAKIELIAEPGRRFTAEDYIQLETYYDSRIRKVHFMEEFARIGAVDPERALAFAADYFTMESNELIGKWFPGRSDRFRFPTRPEMYEKVVRELRDGDQVRIVTDNRKRTNVLVLAGPGSGKTRMLVHRIAFILAVKRESRKAILALAYNRHAAIEIRKRLHALVGDLAKGVDVMTCHAFAARVVGCSFTAREGNQAQFAEMMRAATGILESGEASTHPDERRDRLLAGYRYICIDEYQDIGPDEAGLIAAIAGRRREDEDQRIQLLAVGDDDQAIYSFDEASVEYIRQFETEYRASRTHLLRNYRSTANIIAAAQHLIELVSPRLKDGLVLKVDARRGREPDGGAFEGLDPVARGRVQILELNGGRNAQARAALDELERIAGLDESFDWSRTAIIGRVWKDLEAVEAVCLERGRPCEQARSEKDVWFWRSREVRDTLETLRSQAGEDETVHRDKVASVQEQAPAGGNLMSDKIASGIGSVLDEYPEDEVPMREIELGLAEWGKQIRHRQTSLLLTTAHSAKGLEFDHVVVLDGRWIDSHRTGLDEGVRLYYVAMTRARATLATIRCHGTADWDYKGIPPSTTVHERLARWNAGLRRSVPADSSDIARWPRSANPDEIVLSWAGWKVGTHPAHERIARLKTGDPLEIRRNGSGKLGVFDRDGGEVGMMAKKFMVHPGRGITQARVAGIFERTREQSDPKHAAGIKCERWEVIAPQWIETRTDGS